MARQIIFLIYDRNSDEVWGPDGWVTIDDARGHKIMTYDSAEEAQGVVDEITQAWKPGAERLIEVRPYDLQRK